MEIQKLSDWKYIGKKDIYTVIKEVKMKDPLSRAWLIAVLYIGPVVDDVRPTYVREKQEFLKKFVQI